MRVSLSAGISTRVSLGVSTMVYATTFKPTLNGNISVGVRLSVFDIFTLKPKPTLAPLGGKKLYNIKWGKTKKPY